MKKKDFFKKVISIRTAKNNTIFAGTGVLVSDEDRMYLVTASHVAIDTTTNTDIWYKDSVTGRPSCIKISKLNPMAMWLYHPVADMAVLEVSDAIKNNLIEYTLDLTGFASRFEDVPERESELTMFGLPEVYTDLPYAPFTYNCKVASDLWVAHFEKTGERFNCFMLDKPSVQGFSGGPVMEITNDHTKCFGIIHGTRQDNTGGKLAIVVHSAYLFELIEYTKKKE